MADGSTGPGVTHYKKAGECEWRMDRSEECGSAKVRGKERAVTATHTHTHTPGAGGPCGCR
jgi:hypothetical protein